MNIRHNKRSIFSKSAMLLLMAALIIITYGGVSLSAVETSPMVQLKISVDEIIEILKRQDLKATERYEERKNLIVEVAYKMFNFREMARGAMGKNWKTITPEQQDQFVDLFSTLVKQRYIGKINDYTDQEIVYTKELIKESRAMVYSLLIDKGTEIPIIYKLKSNHGKWLIYDMKIENVSLVLNYRRDFDSVMRKENFSGLVERINQQLKKHNGVLR